MFRIEPRSVIAHGDGENEDAWTRAIERAQHLVRKIGVREIRRSSGSPKALQSEKSLKAERRQDQITPKESLIEGVQAHRLVAFTAQFPDQRTERCARKGMIGVEPVVPEIVLRDAGQDRKFGAHREGTPGRNLEPAECRAGFAAGVEAG